MNYAERILKVICEAVGHLDDGTVHDRAILEIATEAQVEIQRLTAELETWTAAYRAACDIGNARGTEADRLRTLLWGAKEKLQLYRAHHGGEYVGGMEFSELMRRIDRALTN